MKTANTNTKDTLIPMDNIKSEVKLCLDRYQEPYTDMGINSMLSHWEVHKSKLRNTLRKSKYWDESAQAAVYKIEETRAFDADNAKKYAMELFEYVYARVSNEDAEIMESYRWEQTMKCLTLDDNISTFISKEMAETINNSGLVTVAEGEKQSRVWNKLYKKVSGTKLTDKNPDNPEDRNFKSYDKIFAKLADALNPIKVERISCLSIHPNDYLNMSWGTDWRSCHRLGDKHNTTNRGEYCGGTASYMLDNCTAILYTISKKFDGTIYSMEPKIKRQVVCFGDNWFMSSRLYPQGFDGNVEEYAVYRKFTQEIFAECLGIPNLWTIKREGYKYAYANRDDYDSENYLLYTGRGASHYPDYEYASVKSVISYPQGTDFNSLEPVTIGGYSICPNCGTYHTRDEDIYCCNCRDNNHHCHKCGTQINTSDLCDCFLDEKRNLCCPECSKTCADCGKPISGDVYIWVEGKGFVCSDCADNYVYDPFAELFHTCKNYFIEDRGFYASEWSVSRSWVKQCPDCGLWYSAGYLADNGKCPECNSENAAVSVITAIPATV